MTYVAFWIGPNGLLNARVLGKWLFASSRVFHKNIPVCSPRSPIEVFQSHWAEWNNDGITSYVLFRGGRTCGQYPGRVGRSVTYPGLKIPRDSAFAGTFSIRLPCDFPFGGREGKEGGDVSLRSSSRSFYLRGRNCGIKERKRRRTSIVRKNIFLTPDTDARSRFFTASSAFVFI